MPIRVREAIRQLEADGWVMEPRKGTSHRQFKHPTRLSKVTVPGNPGDELDIKTQRSIEKQTGIKFR